LNTFVACVQFGQFSKRIIIGGTEFVMAKHSIYTFLSTHIVLITTDSMIGLLSAETIRVSDALVYFCVLVPKYRMNLYNKKFTESIIIINST
jgi:hypothetical protein